MSHNIFAVFLMVIVITSSGCLDFGDDELELIETDNNTKQEPVGETNMTSLEKRITDLEAKIAEYEMPKVNFMEVSGYNYISTTYEYNVSDDGYLLCSYNEYYERTMCNISAQYYDPNGLVTSYSWEASETSVNQSHFFSGFCQFDVEPMICLSGAGSISTAWTDVCRFGEVNQILTLTIYDNDGNSASASYNLDYDSFCTVEDNPDVCKDGAGVNYLGILYNCVNGQWVDIEPIICPQDHNVTNHFCVPCPGNTTNEVGDDASGSDTTCDGNEPPIIWSFNLMPENITEETTQIATNLNATDPEGGALSVSAKLYLNGQQLDQVSSEYLVNFVFVFDDYGIELIQDDIIHVEIGVMDDSGQSATISYYAQVE